MQVVTLAGGASTWTVVGADGLPVSEVEGFLEYLRLTGCSPNTVRSYAGGAACRSVRRRASRYLHLYAISASLTHDRDSPVAGGRRSCAGARVSRLLFIRTQQSDSPLLPGRRTGRLAHLRGHPRPHHRLQGGRQPAVRPRSPPGTPGVASRRTGRAGVPPRDPGRAHRPRTAGGPGGHGGRGPRARASLRRGRPAGRTTSPVPVTPAVLLVGPRPLLTSHAAGALAGPPAAQRSSSQEPAEPMLNGPA
jgi:hypothetical protein